MRLEGRPVDDSDVSAHLRAPCGSTGVLSRAAPGGAGDGATRAGVAASWTAAAFVDAGAGDAFATDQQGSHERGSSVGDTREFLGGLVL